VLVEPAFQYGTRPYIIFIELRGVKDISAGHKKKATRGWL